MPLRARGGGSSRLMGASGLWALLPEEAAPVLGLAVSVVMSSPYAGITRTGSVGRRRVPWCCRPLSPIRSSSRLFFVDCLALVDPILRRSVDVNVSAVPGLLWVLGAFRHEIRRL